MLSWQYLRKIFKNNYFEEHLWTAVSENLSFYVAFLLEQITYKLHRKWGCFLKNKTEDTILKLSWMKKKTCLFMMCFIILFFSISPLHVRWLLSYIVKNNSSKGLSSSTTNHSPFLDQCNRKINLITHLCCLFRTNYRSSHERYTMRKGLFRNFTKFTGLHQSNFLK